MTRPLCTCATPDVASPALALQPKGEQSGFALDQCRNCKLAWTAPEPSSEQLEQAYGEAYYSSTEAKFNPFIEWWTRFSARRRANNLLKLHGSGTERLSTLDIGCGRGVLLKGFRDLGHQVFGIERAGSGFESLQDIEALNLSDLIAEGKKFDIIVLWHVLEHLPRPLQTLQEVSELLEEGGSLFIEVPNYGGLQSNLFGSYWFHLDVPRHLYHFTTSALEGMVSEAGFRIIREGTFSLDQNLYGFLQSLLNSVPGLPHNHLYSLLQSKLSVRTLCLLLIYVPFVALITVPAVLELLVSAISKSGAVISIQLRKFKHAQ